MTYEILTLIGPHEDLVRARTHLNINEDWFNFEHRRLYPLCGQVTEKKLPNELTLCLETDGNPIGGGFGLLAEDFPDTMGFSECSSFYQNRLDFVAFHGQSWGHWMLSAMMNLDYEPISGSVQCCGSSVYFRDYLDERMERAKDSARSACASGKFRYDGAKRIITSAFAKVDALKLPS